MEAHGCCYYNDHVVKMEYRVGPANGTGTQDNAHCVDDSHCVDKLPPKVTKSHERVAKIDGKISQHWVEAFTEQLV